jgi:hypothetical protein
VSEEARSIRGQKLKRWALSVGKRERERVKSLEGAPPASDPPRPRKETDEIAGERGLELISERGGKFSFCGNGQTRASVPSPWFYDAYMRCKPSELDWVGSAI